MKIDLRICNLMMLSFEVSNLDYWVAKIKGLENQILFENKT